MLLLSSLDSLIELLGNIDVNKELVSINPEDLKLHSTLEELETGRSTPKDYDLLKFGDLLSTIFLKNLDDLLEKSKDEIKDYIEKSNESAKSNQEYLQKIISDLKGINNKIHVENGKYTFENLDLNNLFNSQDESERTEISFFSLQIKSKIQSLLNSLYDKKSELKEDNTSKDKISDQVKAQPETRREERISAFQWYDENRKEKDLPIIYFRCWQNLIDKYSDAAKFALAFSGDYIPEPLNIKWIFKSRNNEISGPSLFYFILELERKGFILNDEWESGNYGPLYKKIIRIFTKGENEPFIFNNLTSSMSVYNHSNTYGKELIDDIITQIPRY